MVRRLAIRMWNALGSTARPAYVTANPTKSAARRLCAVSAGSIGRPMPGRRQGPLGLEVIGGRHDHDAVDDAA